MTIKTFKGILDDGDQDQIYLAGGDGSIGYRIVKFQCMQDGFGDSEMVLKIFKVKQTAPFSASIDFSDDNLLGATMVSGDAAAEHYPEDVTVIFDKEVINQDIFITAAASSSADNINYYLELEEVRMSDAEAANVNFVAALVHT